MDTILQSGAAAVRTDALNYDWAEAWIRSMKRDHNLAPSTIRHRHGALARCFDWMLRKHSEIMEQNPLRLLKRGFATYNEADAAVLGKNGRTAREDDERDRRLEPEEEARILELLRGRNDEQALFAGLGNRLFPFWNGKAYPQTLRKTTSELSVSFARVFAEAGAADFRFHDLRHEATCRLYLRTKLSEGLISKITGHRDLRMLKPLRLLSAIPTPCRCGCQAVCPDT